MLDPNVPNKELKRRHSISLLIPTMQDDPRFITSGSSVVQNFLSVYTVLVLVAHDPTFRSGISLHLFTDRNLLTGVL